VIYVVRASSDSFEIRWREQTYQDGTIVKTETFTSVATIILSFRPTDESMSKNPLGLYIRAPTWSADLGPQGVKMNDQSWRSRRADWSWEQVRLQGAFSDSLSF